MKTAPSQLPAKMPKTFHELNALHPLRPIDDDVDLANAEEMLDRLPLVEQRTKDQNDYLETLIVLTEKYQADELADAMDLSKSSGIDALKYLVETHEMKQA